MKTPLRRFWRDARAAAAVEFALVAVPLLLITLGIIEVGFAFYQWLAAEKATEMGVRRAVVSSPVATDLTAMTGKTAGNSFGDRPMPSYSSTVCSGASASCSNGYTYSVAAMTRIVDAVRTVFPRATAANVSVEYRYAPLGFVGRPCGAVPSVTLRLQNVQFDFIVIHLLANLIPGGSLSGTITMPGFVATKTGEDLSTNGSGC